MTTISIERHVAAPDAGRAPVNRADDAETGRAGVGRETALRAAARRNGLTMNELAAMIGVTPNHLSQIASGESAGQPRRARRRMPCWERSPRRASSNGGRMS